MKKRFTVTLSCATLLLFGATTNASNCEKIFKVANTDEWAHEDIGITITDFNRGKITGFIANGHGHLLPTYDLVSSEKNGDGTFNLYFEGRETGDERRKAVGETAVMLGHQYRQNKDRIFVKTFQIEGQTHKNVYCYGGPE